MPHKIPEYMSANYIKDKTAVDILWKQLQTLQEIASDFGIANIFQDNGAEILQQLIYLNMNAVPGREGNDGVDAYGCEWEMKSIDISKDNAGITTSHHLTKAILEKYRTVPWSVSFYDGIYLKEIYIIGPEQLKPLFDKWDKQLESVSSINNPKIPLKFIKEHGFRVYTEGDAYPVNPLTLINTKPYVSIQKAHAREAQAQKDAMKKGKK